ncbi:MAG TPA: APC family permease [Streptosporangiaceae bacterium]
MQTQAAPAAEERTLRRSLSTPRIVFLVIAAAAPLAALVGTVPLAFAIGDGPGFPAVFVFAGITLLCFSVGYAAMSRRIVNVGGFYTYISSGLGKPVAVAGGLIAVIAYPAVSIGLVGAFGYFAQLLASSHGLNLPWEVWAGAGIGVMAVLGYRQIDLSARVLSILMVAEIGILTVFGLGVVAHKGASAFPTASFNPHIVLGSGVGLSMMFAFISYIGFESAALYGEETHDPRRSVPIATYSAVIIISLFYALISWLAVGAVGPGKVQAVAGKQLGNLFFLLSNQNLNSFATTVMQVFLCTSLFAAMVALHNAGNRYLFALGRERVLPGWFSGVHRRHASPHLASVAQTAVTVVLVSVFAVVGLNPYTNLATTMLGLGTLGIIVLQAAAAASVVPFFWNKPDRHWWRTITAPVLSLAGLITAVVLLLRNFAVLTGTTNPVVTALPWLLLAAAAGGIGYALWMRSAVPARYAGLARASLRDIPETPVPLAAETRRA